MNAPSKETLTWRLQAVMVDRGIQFAKDLKTALETNGISISISSVSRLVYKQPKQIDFALLNGLCDVLRCTPDDLMISPSFKK